MITKRTSLMFRGLAILMVIASHYAGWMIAEPVREQLKEIISTWGVFGVDIFFLLSGYGLVKSVDKKGITWEFVARRLVACYLPYLLIVGFFLMINGGIHGQKEWITFFLGKNYWYIYVQMALYIFFILCYKIKVGRVITVSILTIAFTWWLLNIGRADFWSVSNGAFLVGIYVATIDNKWPTFWKKWSVRVAFLALAFVATIYFHGRYKVEEQFALQNARSMAFTCVVAALCMMIDYKSVVLAALGRYSLAIYLLHGFLYWKYIFLKEEWTYMKSASLTALYTLAVGMVVGFIIEKVFDYILKSLFGRKRRT